jgi:hypothetical protein
VNASLIANTISNNVNINQPSNQASAPVWPDWKLPFDEKNFIRNGARDQQDPAESAKGK